MRTRATRLLVVGALVLAACAAPKPPPAAPPAAAAAPAPAAPLAKAAPPAVPEGPPVTLLPAATARSLLLSSISITSVEALLTKGAGLVARAVPIPVDPGQLRDMLLAQAGLSPEVAANLDLASPSGAAVVATGRPGESGVVMAVAARGPAEAERVIAALGRPVMKRGAVVLVDNGSGGRGWVFRAGNVVVLSDEIEALARGAMLALEARHAVPEDVTAVIYPDAIAEANGTDVKTALGALLEIARASQTEPPPAGAQAGGSDPMMEMVEDVLGLIAGVETAELGLVVDDKRGLALRGRLQARAGSPLVDFARDARPFELDRAVLGGDVAPALVEANSTGAFVQKLMSRQRERLASTEAKKRKGGPAALAFFDAMMAAMSWQTSVGVTMSNDSPPFGADVVYGLKDAASAAKLAQALGRLDTAAALALWEAQVGKMTMFDWSVKKETVGKLKTLHYTLKLGKKAADSVEPLKTMFGKGLDAYVTVAGTRFLATMGKGAKARLPRLAEGKPGTPQGALAGALGAASGRNAFMFLDLARVISALSGLASDARIAAIARDASTPIPLFGTAGGDGAGKAWTFDLTLPPDAFTGVGALIQKAGAGGLGPKP
jgi:hypothetical protein